ncbi:hypothetical protein ACN28E_41835 [Archangium lansingense]|uniref:hypothetical protein n=1 Tax=Archangium lansingense TaxID=2995310 RepID=UPI003B7BCF2B
MKNLLAIPCLMLLLAACGGTSTEEEGTGEQNSIATVQSELDVAVCGFGCSSLTGYVPTAYRCYGGCGDCPSTGDTYTAATGTGCTPSSAATYRACGLDAHPTVGRYAAAYLVDRYCDAVYPSSLGTIPNKTEYRTLPGPDSTFSVCSIGCPAGYTPTGYTASSGCSPTGTTPSQKTSTSCVQAGTYYKWTICGTDTDGCPTGYTVGSRSHTTTCEKPGDSTTGNNSIVCNYVP